MEPPAHTRSAGLATLTLAFLASPSAAQTLVQASVDPGGVPRGGTVSAFSATGRFVLFTSLSADFVPGDTNGLVDVFLRDMELGVTTRVNVDSSGNQETGLLPDYGSYGAAVTPNGRFVLFTSDSTIHVANDTNGRSDVFVRDTWLGTTERVSVDSNGLEASPLAGGSYIGSHACAMTDDARYIVFTSDSPSLGPGFAWDVFVRDRSAGTTVLANIRSIGGVPHLHSVASGISGDGRRVLFVSAAADLVPGDTNGYSGVDLFVRDLDLATTTRISVGPAGEQANGGSDAAAWTPDGRYVSFVSGASNLVPFDTNGEADVFVKDLLTGTVERVSVRSDGSQATWHGMSSYPESSISRDGRFVSFASAALDLVPGDAPFTTDVFVHDRWTASVERISVDAAQSGLTSAGSRALLSEDGRRVVFESGAALVPGDTNAYTDVHVLDRGVLGPFTTFCSGVAARCPCGNGSGSYAGCANSTGVGARLVADGTPSVAFDDFELLASGLTATASALFFQGTTQSNGGAGAVFGDGLLCVGGSIQRLGVRVAAGGIVALGGGGSEPRVSIQGGVPQSGGTRDYQVWYRNVASFCTASAFNLTNGIRVSWSP